MEIIADESVDYAIIQELRASGFKVYSILEQSPGISDTEVLLLSDKINCILLTEDKDFGELTHKMNKRHQGIILIRIMGVSRSEKILMAIEYIKSNFSKLAGRFSVLTRHGIRIKER